MAVSKETLSENAEKKELICPVLSIAASVSKKNTGSFCIKEQCAWYSKSCKMCSIKLI